MDYKTTILKRELKTEEILLPEFENLHFGVMGDDIAVFDYTDYLEREELEKIDYKVFMRMNKRYIQALAGKAGKETSELFFQNTNGHILVRAELAFLFLGFVNPELYIYFNGLLADVITEGVAYSQGFIYRHAAQRLPSDILQEIIKERTNRETDNE